MRLIALAAALWMAAVASAQDARLDALHATLVKLHAHAREATPMEPGGSPELTIAKHQLRDWIETQLASLKDDGDEKAFAARINRTLQAVSVKGAADDQNLLGSLGEVHVRREGDLLVVATAVGILCQNDESAYLYKPANGRWQRIWESEQNDYVPNKYSPQHLISVPVWQLYKDGHEDGPPFVMTLGNSFGCASYWHSVSYRVWRIDPSGAKLLIDRTEDAWLGAPTSGSIAQSPRDRFAPVDVLVEFPKDGIDTNIREAVRHFLIDGDQVRRVDPVALSPRDFVDEWLTRNWQESTTWSASPTLQQWHRRLHADYIAGIFEYPTKHCATPDLWQVGVDLSETANPIDPQPSAYFLVRWRPPYHFTMVDIGDKPWPRCTEKDRGADEWRTLFNTQEWRW
jgi:hypothetical protein